MIIFGWVKNFQYFEEDHAIGLANEKHAVTLLVVFQSF